MISFKDNFYFLKTQAQITAIMKIHIIFLYIYYIYQNLIFHNIYVNRQN